MILCLLPALLFAVPAHRLMAILKAKTIAFILSVAQTNPKAITLAEFVELVTAVPPQGTQDWI